MEDGLGRFDESVRINYPKNTRFLIEQYRVISNNRISHNELFWNFILMFLTAQSFLLILALGGFTSVPWERAIGGFIGFIFGFMSIQGFERNRAMEIADAELLLDIEQYFIERCKLGKELHNTLDTYTYLDGKKVVDYLETKKIMTFLSRGVSYDIWKSGMWLITIVSFLLFLYNIFIFSFARYSGKFLWCASFSKFRTSFDALAIGVVFIVFAVNWFINMITRLQDHKPRKKPTDKQKKTERISYNIAKVLVYFFETVSILIAIIISFYDYRNKIVTKPFMWLYVLIFCLLLTVLLYVLHSLFRRHK
jgi:hypothetical protein